LGKVDDNGVHDNGEIWGQTMWDLRTALGRNDALKIITGGMRLSPSSPSMLTMRDAILQSARVNNVNLSTVWSVFAARGMGFLATTPSANATTATEDFSLPPALIHVSTTVDDKAPRGDGDGFPEPGETLAVTTTVQNTTGSPIASVSGSMTANNGAQVTGGTSNWPTVAAGQNATNDPPFTVKLPEAQACESKPALTVSVTGPNGPVAVPVQTVSVGKPSFTNSTDVPKAIPDADNTGVNSTLTLPGTGNVSDLDVRIGSLTHTYLGDLAISLTHAGTTVVLLDGKGGDKDNFVDLVLDDEAADPITGSLQSTAGDITGRYRPMEPLSAFDGHSRSGAWVLNVRDTGPEDVGTLNAWGVSPALQCDVFKLPTSVTTAASALTTDGATLNGTHNSRGIPTDYQFEYGTSTSYGQKTQVTAGGAGDADLPVTATVANLAPATQYHYRLIALRNGVVHSRGGDQVFTTAALPVTAPPADTTPPDVTVTKAPKKKITTKKAKAKVKVSFGSEAGATFTCRVDKGKATKCGSPFSATVKSKPGKGLKHTIQITATDSAGNVSAPKKVSFKVVRKR
jgi:subtilisin-like proprotein convertase family protein